MNIKKLFLFGVSLVLGGTTLLGCSTNDTTNNNGKLSGITESGSGRASRVTKLAAKDEDVVIPETLTIHYQMSSPAYGNKAFWLWTTGADGIEVPADKVDDFGMVITVHPKKDYPKHEEFCFIIKNKGEWAGQSSDTIINYRKFKPDDKGNLEVWCLDGEGNSIDVYATFKETQGARLKYAKFIFWDTIKLKATGPMLSYKIYAFDKTYDILPDAQKIRHEDKYIIAQGDCKNDEVFVRLDSYQAPNVHYVAKVVFEDNPTKTKRKDISMEPLYDTDFFNKNYTYEGDDLGVTYTKEYTEFRVWSPMSSTAYLRVYSFGTPGSLHEDPRSYMDSYREYEMEYCDGGVWYSKVEGDLNGKYYTYVVSNASGTNEVSDPYATAAGLNGKRSMVLDFASTNPEGWDNVPLVWDKQEGYDIKSAQDLSVYEIHIRDLTMDESWNGKSPRGTFPAFAEKGTTVTDPTNTDKVYTTGFDHIEELGVKAIQILPSFDHDNDERKEYQSFNWGYNPANYNVVEGSYSTDPTKGEVRVKEFKDMVMAYANNKNHTRVIMDVVYNHVASVTNSNFTKIMPRYYFRVNKSGFYTDGAGCGNEVKTEAPMMRKFIVDSVKWWASEYKIKGFRFDLMGLIDVETMRLVKEGLYEIDPDIVVYGEGWSAGAPYCKEHMANTGGAYAHLGETTKSKGLVGGFNDGGRNATRGGNDQGWGKSPYPGEGFMTLPSANVGGNSYNVAKMLHGINSNNGNAAVDARQTVNYVSCHDNYTTFDQLSYALRKTSDATPAFEHMPDMADVASASLSAHALAMFSQGIGFMQGGEEIFRSKEVVHPELEHAREINPFPTTDGSKASTEVKMFGKIISHNSYNLRDEVNSFKWNNKISVNGMATKEYIDAFKGIISARNEITQYEYPLNGSDTKVEVKGAGEGSTGLSYFNGNMAFFISGGANSSMSFDPTGYELVLNTRLGNNDIAINNNTISLNKYQLVLYRKVAQ